MKKHNLIRGFTLIEMLVVIAIIAILTGVILVSISGARAKSRDGKRISDVSQIQLALEQYFDRCGAYPSTMTTGANCTTSNNVTVHLSDFISAIPTPPAGAATSQNTYDYAKYPMSGPPFLDYRIHAYLENSNANASTQDNLTYANGSSNTGYPLGWLVIMSPSSRSSFACSTASNSTDYCVGPK